MIDARTVAYALDGDAFGDRVLAPGPGHGKRDRSLAVCLSATAPDGFLVHSFSGDDFGDCRDYVRYRLGLDRERPAVLSKPARAPDQSAEARRARALEIWRETRPAIGTPVEAYLRSRGLSFPLEAIDAIRWHPACPFGPNCRTGAMVALIRGVVSDHPIGIHRTALSPDGKKRVDLGGGGRLVMGSKAGGAIKITPDADVSTCLGVGEGIESTLSLRALPEFGLRTSVWALLDAGNLAALPPLPGIESLFIAVDHDPAGIRAARDVSAAWSQSGCEVHILTPTTAGADLNDLGALDYAA
jgi:putative DNA primase/helicase